MKVGIIDYGMGNLRSVVAGFKRVDVEAVVVKEPRELKEVDKIVIPGVGAFGDAVINLERKGFIEALHEEIKRGKPLIGICLGFQLLFEESEESPGYKGFGLFRGKIKRFPALPGIRIPHIGWNAVNFKEESALFRGLRNGTYFYFVHSYYADSEGEFVSGRTEYYITFASAVEKGNIAGTQFHPEKSQRDGLKVLRNFALYFGES